MWFLILFNPNLYLLRDIKEINIYFEKFWHVDTLLL